jgi:hypothetical protein
MNVRQFDFVLLGLPGFPDLNINKVRAGDCCSACYFAGVHATGGDQIGLGGRVGGENLQQGYDVVVGEVAGFTAHEAADKAARQTAVASDIGLAEAAEFGLTLEGHAEVAHEAVESFWSSVESAEGRLSFWLGGMIFFATCVALYAHVHGMQCISHHRLCCHD